MPAASTTRPVIYLLFMFSFLFLSCNTNNGDKVIRAMEESLQYSNNSLNISSQMILHSLEDKAADYATKTKAEIWLPRAKLIQDLSESVYKYLENMKTEEKFDISLLYEKLITYKSSILAIDSSIWWTFSKNTLSKLPALRIDSLSKESFSTRYFNHTSLPEMRAMLTKLQNDIRITENKTITFCHEQIAIHDFIEYFSAIAVANTSYVKPGQKIEITAGIGALSTYVMPIITINNKKIELNDWGAAVHSFKASSKPGKHYILVKIEYTDHDGRQNIVEKTIEYTVAKPCDQ